MIGALGQLPCVRIQARGRCFITQSSDRAMDAQETTDRTHQTGYIVTYSDISGINVRLEMHYVRRATIGLMILMFMSLSAAAQGGFSEQIIIVQSDVVSPLSVYAADLDGDGDQDVLSASIVDSNIESYEI